MVAAGIVELVVDAKDKIERFSACNLALHGAGHHNALESELVEIGLEGLRGFELAAAFEHHLHARLVPSNGQGIRLLAVAQGVGSHLETIASTLALLVPAAMDRVELKQVGGGGAISEEDVRTALADAAFGRFFEAEGAQTAFLPGAEYQRLLASETARWRQVAVSAGLKVD